MVLDRGNVRFAKSHTSYEDGMGGADPFLASKTESNVLSSYEDGKEAMERPRMRRSLHRVKRTPPLSLSDHARLLSVHPLVCSISCLGIVFHASSATLHDFHRARGALEYFPCCRGEVLIPFPHIEKGHLGPPRDDP